MLARILCSILASALLARGGDIVINEIMYHPPPAVPEDTGLEWIELHNQGTNVVSLSGWRLARGVQFTFPAGAQLAPGGYLVVVANVAKFRAQYPAVEAGQVFGSWTGRLSNSDETIELVNAQGEVMSRVHYASEGDWATRVRGPLDQGTRGWQWSAEHDGLGRTLELANPRLPSDTGQNWQPSATLGGTPAAQNSVFTHNAAPLILEVKHFPVVPSSSSPVTLTARVQDDLAETPTVRLFYRDHTGDYRGRTPPAFTAQQMLDDGLHDDGAAGDGVYGVVLPAMASGTIIEFYVQASDDDSNVRTWPAPAREADNSLVQAANALFQVDNEVAAGDMPFLRLVTTGTERATFASINSNSDAEMNATFLTLDDAGFKVRHNVGFRIRGAGSRSRNPKNLRVNIPNDRRWNGLAEINLNCQFIHAQLAGSVLAQKAGLACADARRVQLRLNGVNQAPSTAPVNGTSSGAGFGSYLLVEPINGDWADHHFPNDPDGNVYRASRYPWTANLDYLGTDYASYVNAGYAKTANQSQNDWSDLFGLTYALSPHTPDASYVEAVRERANVEKWLLYFAVCNFFDYQETSLCLGVGDDYAMYRGVNDPRFQLVAHDFDTILGQGDSGGSTTRSIWVMVDNPRSTDPSQRANFLNRFMRHPDFAPLYFRLLKELCDTTFSAAQLNSLLDQQLGSWVPEQMVTAMKTFAANRRASILSQIPLSLSVSSDLPTSSGYAYTTSPVLNLSGFANAIETRSVRVAGDLASWTPWQGRWSAVLLLQPGINRVLVQAFNADSQEIERSYTDIWYDDGTIQDAPGTLTANTTWTAEDGPYRLNSTLTIANGVTLTIAPGATVYLGASANLTVASGGRLLAEGTANAPIRFTRVPGTSSSWGSLIINGDEATPETRITHAHLEFNGGTAIRSVVGTVWLANLTFGTTTRQYLDLHASSFVVSDCIFPATTASFEPVHGTGGVKPGGRGLFLRNFFSPITGYNDSIDFSGGHRPGPIVQFINNVFMGTGDDHLDLDNTDAWVEGNIFLHAHKNGSPDTASAVSGGSDTGEPSEITLIGNLIYDCDHAANAKQGNFYTLLNNTIVRQTRQGGTDTDAAVVVLADNNMPEGAGMYLEGNIIYDAEKLTRNVTNALVTFTNNLMALPWTGPGGGNVAADPLFKYLPDLSETYFPSWRHAQVLRDWFSLRAGSPARGAGPNGRDLGGVIPRGVSLFGEPLGTTNQSLLTLTVGLNRTGQGITPAGWPDGSGFTHYQWRRNAGPWSPLTPLTTPILLTNLAQGAHYVEAVGVNDAGLAQNDPVLGSDASITRSRTWFVNTNYVPPAPRPLLRLNEILASNQRAVEHEETFPDLIELYNAGDAPADLSGLGLSDDAADPGRFRFPPGVTLAPGAYLVVYADNSTRTSGFHLGFNLNKEGESVYLFDTAARGNALLDSVTFGLQLTDLSIGRLADGVWGLTRPTFGAVNEPVATGQPRLLKINEWLAASAAGQSDFIELFNPGPRPVALGGLYLTDNAMGWPNRHPIAALSYIPASGLLVFQADGDSAAGPDHLNFKLSTESGMVGLLDAQLAIIDQVFYGPQTTGISEGRRPSGADQFAFFNPPTPGAPNPGGDSGTTVTTTVIPLVSWTNFWRFDVTGPDWGTEWRETTFDDSFWSSGRGMFYAGDGGGSFAVPIYTYLPIFLPQNRPTYYFRTTFTLNTNAAGFNLVASHYLDDGAVVYLNGTEIYRYNMPGGTVTYYTWAASTISGDAGLLGPVTLPAGSLVQGTNVLAVELHQVNSGSSDITLGFKLDLSRSETNSNTLPVTVHEIMANNVSVTNEDGLITDWVELFNPAPRTADLSDMSLTDSPANPRRWVFPPGVTIPAGGFLLVRCDPDTPASLSNVVPLNTGFGLKAEGDRLLLFDKPANGMAQMDGLLFGLQAPDFTLGRQPRSDGKGDWVLTLPTPGAGNIAASMGDVFTARVNEWMADPRSGEDWFELYNPNSQPVAIGRCYLTDDLNNRAKSQIPPYSYLGIGSRAYGLFYADSQPALGANHANFRLSREGEAVGLYSPLLQLIDSVRFGFQATGISEGRLLDGSTNIVRFPESVSPAAANYLPLLQVVISEVLPDPSDPLEDAIELYNPTAESVDLSGWWLSNARYDLQRFRIPAGTILLPDGYVVFYRYQFDPDFNDLAPNFTLNRVRGDEIYLSQTDSLGRLTGFRAVEDFGPAEDRVSFGRYESSTGPQFPALSQRTFGADTPASVDEFRAGLGGPNASPRVGPVVINEIMYHPPDLGTNDNFRDEYLELHNITAEPVPLFDPNHPTNTWHVRDGVDFNFPTNVTLPPHGFLLLVGFDPATNAANVEAFRVRFSVPAAVPVLGPFNGRLANDGESIDLRRPEPPVPPGRRYAGEVAYVRVDRARYYDTQPWPSAADGSTNQPGISLQRVNPSAYGNDPVNWLAGSATAGQPTGPAVLEPPAITSLTPAQLVAGGTDVTLTVVASGAGTLRYEWRFNGRLIVGATNASLLLPNVQKTHAGRYAVLVSNPAGAAAAATRVDLVLPPSIGKQPDHRIVAEGATAVFSVAVAGTPPLSYQWYKDGEMLPGATHPSLVITNVQPVNEGGYVVTVTNVYGAVTSTVASLLIQTPPFLLSQPQGTNVYVGETATFRVEADGSEPLFYQWRFNGVNLPGATNTTLVLSNVQPSQAGGYTVLVSNAVDRVLSASAALGVAVPPVVTVQATTPLAYEQGLQSGVFRITRTGSNDTALTVFYDVTGTATPGSDYAALSGQATIPPGSANVTVLVTPLDDLLKEPEETILLTLRSARGYVLGASTNAAVTLMDNDNLHPVVVITAPTPGAAFVGPTNILITAEALDLDGSVARVEFYSGTNKLGEATSATSTFAFTWSDVVRGSYSITAAAVDNLGARTVSAPVNLMVTSPQSGFADLFVERGLVTGASLSLRATNTAFTRETGEPAHDGRSGVRSAWVSWTAPVSGLCIMSTFGSTFDTVLAVYTNDPPSAQTLPSLVRVTSNDDAASGGLQSQVSFFASAGVTYQVAVDGYSATDSGIIQFQASLTPLDPIITYQPRGETVNAGATVSFSAGAAGTAPLSFQWQFNEADLPGATNISLTLTNVQLAQAGDYRLKVTGAAGSVRSASATLVVVPAGPITLSSQPQGLSVRSGTNVTFSVVAEGTAPLRYQWQFYGTNLFRATNATLSLTNVHFTHGGPYQVVVSNAQGTVTSDLAVLRVDDELTFRILDLQTNGARAIDINSLVGYDQSGMAVSTNRLFLAGASGTARWDAGTLAGGVRFTPTPYAGLVANLRTEQVYVLANGTNPITSSGTINSLLEVNPDNGSLAGNRINLSTNFFLGWSSGLFVGYDRLVIHNNSDYHLYDIALPSGRVTDLGYAWFNHQYPYYGWAFSGFVEYYGGALYLVYVEDSTRISRARVRVGGYSQLLSTPVAEFSSLGNMANLAFSPSRSRWYFRHRYSSQFANFTENAGSAKAAFAQGAGMPIIYVEPQPQLSYPDSNVTFRVVAAGQEPLSYHWRLNGTTVVGANNATLVLTNLQVDMAGDYSVIVSNPVAAVASAAANLYIVSTPEILAQPTPRSVIAGSNTTFTVGWRAALPVAFQWRLNGTNIAGATNASLALSNISSLHAGLYSVALSNRFGVTVSSNALLALVIDTGFSFRIRGLGRDATLVEHQEVTGGDLGGLAVGADWVVYNGTAGAGRFAAEDLSGGTPLGRSYPALVSDLRGQKVYALASGTELAGSYSTVDNLREVDPATGQLRTNRIYLSQTIYVPWGSGLFAGYGQVVIFASGRAYAIALPSGVVADLGNVYLPSRQITPGWAFWGVAENFGGYTYLVYAANTNSIVRTRVPDGATTTVANFVDLGNLACLSVSVPRGRWYFHYAGQNEFGGTNQSLGFASATFDVQASQVLDHFGWGPIAAQQYLQQPIPVTLTAQNVLNSTVTNFNGMVDLVAFNAATGQQVPVAPVQVNGFSQGVWSGGVTVSQPGDELYLQAQIAGRPVGDSPRFRVDVLNDLRLTMTAPPLATLGAPHTYTLSVSNSGPLPSTAVWLTNGWPADAVLVGATASQGACTNVGGVVVCDLGTVGPASTATVTLTVAPAALGSLTNVAVVARAEPDLRPDNNHAALVTSVLPPYLVIDDVTITEGTGPATLLTFRVTLSFSNAQWVSVHFATTNGTARSGTDYQARSGTLFFPPGVTEASTNVSVIADSLLESEESFYVVLSQPTNAVLVKGTGTMTLLDDDLPASLTVTNVSVLEGNAGTTTVTLPLRLSRSLGLPASVSFATANGTAIAGSDYVATNGTVSISPPLTLVNLNLRILANTRGEPDKTFFVNLFDPVNTTLVQTQVVVTILNDDGLGVLDHFEWEGVRSTEWLNVPIPVTLTARDFNGALVTGYDGQVNLSGLSGGSGVQNLVLGTGNNTWNYPISTYYHDARCSSIYLASELGGPRRIFGLALNVTQLSAGNVNQTMNNFYIRLKHTSRSSFTSSDDWENSGWTEVYHANETLRATGWVNFAFTAPFDYNGGANLLVDFSFNNDSYTSDGYVTATSYSQNRSLYYRCDSCSPNDPLQWTRNIPGVNVSTYAPNLRLILGSGLSISPPLSGRFTNGVWSGTVRVLEPAVEAQLMARDTNQFFGVSRYFDVLPYHDLALRVTPSAEPTPVGQNLSYTMAVSNSGPTVFHDVWLTNGFPTNAEWIGWTVDRGSVTPLGDTLLVHEIGPLEAGEVATLTVWVRPTNAVALTNFAVVTRSESEFYLPNNAATNVSQAVPLGLTVGDVAVKEGDFGLTNLVFHVSLSAASTQAVSVAYATLEGGATAGSDFAPTNGSLVFPPGVTNLSVAVPVVGDRLNETNETFFLVLSEPENAPLVRPQAVGVIVNDDPMPIIYAQDVEVLEGHTGLTPARPLLTLSEPSGQRVTVQLLTLDGTARSGSDYVYTNGTATFEPGVTELPWTLLVRADTVPEDDETFLVNLRQPANATLGAIQAQVTIRNDDGAPGQISRFDWTPIASPQPGNQGFLVTVSARDAFGSLLTNFNSAAALRAVASGSLTNAIILGDLVLTNSDDDPLTLAYDFTPLEDLTVTHFRHYSGARVSLWTASGIPLATRDVSGPEGVWSETPLSVPLLLQAGVTYRLGVFNGDQRFYYNAGAALTFSHGTLGQGYVGGGDTFPTESTGAINYFGVDLRYTASAPPHAVAMTPAQTTPFVNGVWFGEVTILEPATSVRLIAETGQASGTSNPFDVVVPQADLSLVASAYPAPALAGQPVTLKLTVYNRGPDAAHGVWLTNALPPELTLLTVQSSQGSWTNAGPWLVCDLGVLTNRRSAHVEITAQPVYPSTDTNLATVLANLAVATLATDDPDPANNQSRLRLTILADHDLDGMADLWEAAHGLDRFDPLDGDTDADGDGFSNRREYEFGTDPRDPLSMVRFTQIQVLGGDVHLSFPTVNGRRYELQTVTDPTAQPVIWEPLGNSLEGDGGMKTFTHVGGAHLPQCFYRIVVGL
jgi:uncharacterized repeat protein (TIGR01451 family)